MLKSFELLIVTERQNAYVELVLKQSILRRG